MRRGNGLCKRPFDTKGYTLLELLAVLVILGIVALIAVPSVVGSIEKAKEEVCRSNRLELSKSYNMQLQSEGMEHSEGTFNTFLLEIDGTPCPENGLFTYEDGVILCNLHPDDHNNNDSDDEDEEDDEVPYL